MWTPQSEEEIVEAVQSGSLEETAIFDAKRELPRKNPETAKDIAAMANDGGVLIYGIDEDASGRPSVLHPIPLKGKPEKINMIVRTSIDEPPEIEIHTFPSADDPSKGYIVVVVPASERAPHMVVVKGENRFYGRTATGNKILTQGEVARLYQRREGWQIDRDALLDAEIAESPIPPRDGFGYLYLVIRPVIRHDDCLERAVREGETISSLLHSLVKHGKQSSVYPSDYDPDLRVPSQWIRRVEGFSGNMDSGSSAPGSPADILRLQVDFDGSAHLFCGRAAEQTQRGFLFIPQIIAGLTVRLLALAGWLYGRAQYVGPVDVGVAVTGVEGSFPYHSAGRIVIGRRLVPYDRDQYRRTERFQATTLAESPCDVARRLWMPFFDAISQGTLDPFTIAS